MFSADCRFYVSGAFIMSLSLLCLLPLCPCALFGLHPYVVDRATAAKIILLRSLRCPGAQWREKWGPAKLIARFSA